jgi:hypothetical protein
MSASASIVEIVLDANAWSSQAKFVASFAAEAEWIRGRIEHCCRHFAQHDSIPKFRVFVDNGNRTDLAVRLRGTAMRSEETMHQWISRAVGSDRYCLAFNGITAWDEPLARYVSRRIVSPIVKALGSPTRGFDVYLFAGKYDITPFGIHRDREPSILIHLGPAQKVALVWAADIYRRLDGVREEINEFDLERAEASAERRVLNDGDLIYIPAGDPPVMRSDDFSITLGVIPNLLDEKGVFAELAREMADLSGDSHSDASFIRSGEKLLSKMATFCGPHPEWRPKLDLALKSILLRLESNGYLVPSPIDHPRTSVEPTDTLRVPADYPINFTEREGKLCLYARGRMVQAPGDPLLIDWISKLRPGDTFAAGEVYAALSAAWDGSAVEKLLTELIGWRALERDTGAGAGTTQVVAAAAGSP